MPARLVVFSNATCTGCYGRRKHALAKLTNINNPLGSHPGTPQKKVHKRSAKSAGISPKKPVQQKAQSTVKKVHASSKPSAAHPAPSKRGAARTATTIRKPVERSRATAKQTPSKTARPAAKKPSTAPVAKTQRKLSAGKSSSLLQPASRGFRGADGKGAPAAGPKPRTESTGRAFGGFFVKHLNVMLPITLVIVFFLGFGVVDLFGSWGKIHRGVTVEGVDVGGLTIDEASNKLNEQLSPVVQSMSITVYKNSDIASKDGVDLNAAGNTGEANVAYADEKKSDNIAAASDIDDDGSADKWNVNANTIGAYVDGNALATQAFAYGREGNFIADRFVAYFSPKNYQATISYNQEFFNSLVSEINEAAGTATVNSTFAIDDGKVSLVSGKDGYLVDETPFVTNISRAAFNTSAPYCEVPMHTVTRNISDETAQKIVDQVSAAIKDDVTVTYQSDSWTLDSAALGKLVGQTVLQPGQIIEFSAGKQSVTQGNAGDSKYDMSTGTDSSGYALQAYIDQSAFDKYLVSVLGDKARGGAVSASFDTSDGETVKVVPSVEGSGPDRATAEISLQNIVFGNGKPIVASKDGNGKTVTKEASSASRTIELQDTVIEPDLTTDEANAMGITERLATWSIPLSGTTARINNIRLLCKMINNSLVAPGDVWSFNQTTGERTEEKGFDKAAVIVDGKHEDQLGGGVCQVATCIYNAACFSGLGIENRVNHDFYIPAYDDEGFADATVSWESPDFAFKNDMSTYVLMTATASGDNVVVSMWGTKDGRQVKCERGEWQPGDKYVQVTESTPDLPAGTTKITQTGQDGRKIDIHYYVTSASGEVLHDVTFHSIYSAQNEITSVGTGPAAS